MKVASGQACQACASKCVMEDVRGRQLRHADDAGVALRVLIGWRGSLVKDAHSDILLEIVSEVFTEVMRRKQW